MKNPSLADLSSDELPDDLPILNLTRSDTTHLPALHLFASLEKVSHISVAPETQNLQIFFDNQAVEFNGNHFSPIHSPSTSIKRQKNPCAPDSPEGAHIVPLNSHDEFEKPKYRLVLLLPLPSGNTLHFLSKTTRWKVAYLDKEFELPALPLSAHIISEDHFFIRFFNHSGCIYHLPVEEKQLISRRKTTLFEALNQVLLPDLIRIISSFLNPKFSSAEISKLVTFTKNYGLFSEPQNVSSCAIKKDQTSKGIKFHPK